MLKVILDLTFTTFAVGYFIVTQRKIKNLRKVIRNKKSMIKQYKLLLKHIAHRCDECCKENYFNNPAIGFRKVKELTNTIIVPESSRKN